MKLSVFGTILPAALLALCGCTGPGDSAQEESGDAQATAEASDSLVAARWSYGGLVPGVGAAVTPGLGVVGNNLFMAYPGGFGNQLYFNTFNGSTWSGATAIAGAYSAVSPALSDCACNGGLYGYAVENDDGSDCGSSCDLCDADLYMAYPSLINGQIYTSGYNNGAWGTPMAVPGAYSYYSPALMPYRNTFNMAWVGAYNQVYISTLNNGVWSAGAAINGVCCDESPSLGVYGGSMYMACGCQGDTNVAVFNGTSWNGLGGIGVATPYSPAIVGFGGGLNAFYVNANRGLMWSTYGGGGAWGAGVGIAGFSARGGVAVTPFGGGLVMAGAAVGAGGLWWGTYH